MKYIFNFFKLATLNWTNRVFSIVFLGMLTYSLTHIFEAKSPKQDCTYYIEQNKQLVGALIEIRKDLQPQLTSFTGNNSEITFALLIDTVPKPKVSAQVNRVLNKIDSLLLKIKQDSINRSKQIRQTKNS